MPTTPNAEEPTYYNSVINEVDRAWREALAGCATGELEHLWVAAQKINDLTFTAVDAARKDGASWSTIGTALQITKQAAQQRYGA